jgi:hypothetical protein
METTDPWFVAFMVLFSLLGISGLMYMGYIPRVAGTGAATAAGGLDLGVGALEGVVFGKLR